MELRPTQSIPCCSQGRHPVSCLSVLNSSCFLVTSRRSVRKDDEAGGSEQRSPRPLSATLVQLASGVSDNDERLGAYCDQLVGMVEQQAQALEAKTDVVNILEQRLLEYAAKENGLREKIVETRQSEIRSDHQLMENERIQEAFTQEAEAVVQEMQNLRQ